jgi:hypothetical protein
VAERVRQPGAVRDDTSVGSRATLDYRTTPTVYPAHPEKHTHMPDTRIRRRAGRRCVLGGRREDHLRDLPARATEARTYIHLEDQYFTPNSSPDLDNAPGSRDPNVFLDVLLDAAAHCRRLVVMLPREGDQPMGGHRRAFVISKLRAVWGDRIFIGVPLRRPFLPDPGVVASKGRAVLGADIAASSDGPLLVGPAARVPKKPPFWCGSTAS